MSVTPFRSRSLDAARQFISRRARQSTLATRHSCAPNLIVDLLRMWTNCGESWLYRSFGLAKVIIYQTSKLCPNCKPPLLILKTKDDAHLPPGMV